MSVPGRRETKLRDELRELEERLEHLSAATAEGVFVHDGERILDLNQAGASMFGYEPRELQGRNVLDLASKDSRPDILSRMSAGFQGTYQTFGLRKDGSTFPVELHVRTVALGPKTVRAVTARDVTVAKQTEEELRRTRDLLLKTEQLARSGSWSWEPDSGRTTWSPGMYRHYGLSSDDPASPLEISLRAIHAEDLPRLRQHMIRARETLTLEPIEYRVWVAGAVRYHRTVGEVHRDPETGSVRMVGFVQDVTALRQMEEERLRAEQERDRLFESSVDLLSVAGFDGYLKQVNPAWTRTFGWTAEELLSRPFRDFVHPEDLPITLEAGARVRRGEPVTRLENRCRHRDGLYRWLSWSTRSLPDAELMLSVARDVTDEKAAREELENEVSFRNSIVTGAAEGLAVCHETPEYPHVRFTVWNDRMTEITGYTMDEINRLGWYQTVYPDAEIRERARERMGRMREGDDLHGEEWIISRKDREKRVLRISTSVLKVADDRAHVLALMDDVTERRRAEEALRESEMRYRSLFEGAPYGIYRSTPDGRFAAVNGTLAAMLGYAPEELAGSAVRDLYQDPAEWSRLVAESRDGKPIQGLDVVWMKKDGSAITVRLSGRPLVGEGGVPMGLEMIVEDVTERRLLEEQFRQAQKMEAVGQLAGGIAHDFNNLLTAVSGYADLLRARTPPEDPRRSYVEEIGAAADRAAALTRQLLAFSRRQILEPRVVNVEEMVRNVERMLRRIIGEDIELETRLTARGSVRADVSQLEQVLMNLAVNARDAMPEGGKLLIEADDVEVRGGQEPPRPGRGPMPPGSYVRLAVSDTGIGMERSALSHIFEPFFTTKEPGKGTGLGLATVYGIVKQSEGFIWVSSEPGRGARFEVYLPRVSEPAEAARTAPAGENLGGCETILLVEDEERVRFIVSEMLEWYGYTVLRAPGAAEAVTLARSHSGPIHLLLTDVVMPRLSGRALRDEISIYRPRIPVLYMSGYAGEDRTRDLLTDGAAFLAKPFTAAALARKVREVLANASAGELTPGPV